MEESSLLLDLVEKASKIVAYGLAYRNKITRETLKSTTNQLASLLDQIEQCIKETHLPIDGIENLKGNFKATQRLLRNYPRLRWWNMSSYLLLKLVAAEKSLVRHISFHYLLDMARDLEVIRSNLSSDGSHSRQILLADTHALNELNFDLNLSTLPEKFLYRTPSSSSSFFAASSPSSRSLRKHDVFVSFRGDDIRTGFKSHLCDALSRKNIDAYVDDRLDKGGEIWAELVTAIKDSVLFLVIFSENYASSKWCLRELTQILESTKDRSHRVMPVFYKIDPSHVRNQTGSYHKAFTEHQHHHDEEEVSKWRENLNRAGNLVGWDSSAYGNEVELIQKIVTCVTKKLDTMFQSVYSSGLFGIDEQIADVESLLCNESQDVQVIGIWGMAGIGKTTISTQLFNKMRHEFESSCFLDNIREESEKSSISFLRRKLLSTLLEDDKLCMDMSSTGGPTKNAMRRLGRKRVIIVLDDVNDPLHLVHLVRVPSEFGKGSIIIITARDKQVFGKTVNSTNIYEVKALNLEDARQLFKFHASNTNCFENEFEQLSEQVVDYAKGFPSTLVALGSFLYGKSIEECKRKWEKITKISCMEIQKILKLSYDGMDEEKKSLLLDIASTLNDRKAEHIKKLLDEFGYSKIHGLTDILEGSNGEQKKEGDEILNPSDHEDTQNMGFQLMMIKHSNFR